MILRNSGICPDCNEEIVSRFRHDFVKCKCGESFVDGGLSYLRRNRDLLDTSISTHGSFFTIREGFEWGTYGKNGDEELHYIKLKDISDNHLDNILKLELLDHIKELFEKEKEYRRDK